MRRTESTAIVIASILAAASVSAQTVTRWYPVPAQAHYLTGDSWLAAGTIYRLYGVQSCLRGTSFTNAHGIRRDCGEASLAMLIALTRDLKPQCYDAVALPQSRTVFVFCVAARSEGSGAGSRIDLGTALIATGFAFAALKPDGKPVHESYLVAQNVARQARAGLWAFADLPDPNAIISRALQQRAQAPVDTPSPR